MERFLNLTKKGADLYRSTAIEMMESTIKDWSKLFGVRAVLIALHNAAAHGEMFDGRHFALRYIGICTVVLNQSAVTGQLTGKRYTPDNADRIKFKEL